MFCGQEKGRNVKWCVAVSLTTDLLRLFAFARVTDNKKSLVQAAAEAAWFLGSLLTTLGAKENVRPNSPPPSPPLRRRVKCSVARELRPSFKKSNGLAQKKRTMDRDLSGGFCNLLFDQPGNECQSIANKLCPTLSTFPK